MLSKFRLISIALLGTAVATKPAVAQPAQVPAPEQAIVITHKLIPSPDLMYRTVHIGDLDLKSAAGQKEMETRVKAAVEEMCAIPKPIPTQERNMTKPCRDEAWDSARPQMVQAIKQATGS